MISEKKDKLELLVESFLQTKTLSLNSEKSYRYDLHQFLEQTTGDITDTRLKLYQEFLKTLAISAAKRKQSAVNQFLFYLYQVQKVSTYHRLSLDVNRNTLSKEVTALELSSLYSETAFKEGQVIALLIVELGLTPSEIASLETQSLDLTFRILTCQTNKTRRVLQLPEILLPFLEKRDDQTYYFQNGDQAYSRQWYFRRLSEFLEEKGFGELTAQKLREQFIVRQVAQGQTIFEIAKALGLKTSLSLEKYFKH
ncbi:site-specific tyrosine recombinase XerD [Streptococcus saliviloxodontae]|uniref:Tyrosine recombinase XerD-like n=1 Tax=Streptococcus saliviloxodontae TaxID=1349416 RepID=A0ABS2PKV7_9STRE|nr:site-specific tyrosine recombinase XerD [Streptococcus saliviloxodontae]MBM7635620.1 integrase [Streptococcus saliviloxodontae]